MVVTVPDAVIVRIIVTVPGPYRAFHRLKNLVFYFKRDAHAGEQLPHRRVVADANLAHSDLHWHVEVANLPAGLGRLGGVALQTNGQAARPTQNQNPRRPSPHRANGASAT